MVSSMGMMDRVDVENVSVTLWDHRDISEIDDDFQFVIESGMPVDDYDSIMVQDVFDDKGGYSVDLFIADTDLGCRERTVLEDKNQKGGEN